MSSNTIKGTTATRRTVLAGMGAAGVALASPAIVRAQPKQIVMANGGGKLADAYKVSIFDPWTEKTGIEVVSASNKGAQLKAMVEEGNMQWDVLQGPAEAMPLYAREGLLEPLDYTRIDKSKMVEGTARDDFVITDFAAYHVAWNTENLDDGPADWADMFAVDGRISLWKRPFQTLEATLLADGVSPRELYPLDIDRAFAALDKVKDKLLLWDSGAQGAQMLIDGEVEAGAIWNGRVHQPKIDGAPVDYTFNQAVLVSDAWCVPKGAPNKDAAMDLIAYSLTAEAQAAYSQAIPYAPVNTDALALIPDDIKASLPAADDSTVMLDVDYWADNLDEVNERFNTWLLS